MITYQTTLYGFNRPKKVLQIDTIVLTSTKSN